MESIGIHDITESVEKVILDYLKKDIEDSNKKKKERTCFSFLSISDGGISAWGMYRRNLRWRKESKGG